MTGTQILILVVSIAIVAAAILLRHRWAQWLYRLKHKPTPFPIDNFPMSFPFGHVTDSGVLVASVVSVPKSALDAIDAGIAAQIARMPPEWHNAERPIDYTLRFINPDARNEDGSPALMVRGTNMGQPVKVKSAGTVIGVEGMAEGGSIFICLPHQEDQGWQFLDYLSNTVWNEAEHWSEYMNDRAEFRRWATIADRHPHRPNIVRGI